MRRLMIIPEINRLEESMELAAGYGCSFEYNDFYYPETLDDRGKQRELTAAYRSVRGSFSQDTLHGAFYDLAIHSADSKIREISCLRVRQSMELASELGVRGVVFHTGLLRGFRLASYLEHWVEANRDFFCRILEEYPGIEIYMENMFDERPDVLAGLAEEMKGCARFGVCLDLAHASLTSCGWKEWFTALAPYVRHMHINDNDLVSDLHLPVGDGQIDWEQYGSLTAGSGISPSVLVEVRGIEKQRRSLEFMRTRRLFPLEEDHFGH